MTSDKPTAAKGVVAGFDPSRIRLTDLERRAMRALAEGRYTFAPFGYGAFSFKAIGTNGRIPLHLVRRTVRRLARKGLAEFHKGLWTDDGMPGGAGYALTDNGCAALDALGRA